MKSILLITAGFPYGTSEHSFLQTEFDEMKKHFDITVLARRIPESDRQNGYEDIDVRRYDEKKEIKLLVRSVFNYSFLCEIRRIILSSNKAKDKWKAIRHAIAYGNKALVLTDQIRSLIIEKKIDCIYTYWCTPATLASVWIKKKNKSIKVISRFHGYDLYNERTDCNWQSYRYEIARRLDRLLFACETGKNYFASNWGVQGDLAYLGTKANHRIIPNEHYFVLVSCSNLIKLKRVELIIQALAHVNENCIIAWYHFGDGEERTELELMAHHELDKKENITYSFVGFLQNDLMLQQYEMIKPSLFITTSSTEGSPVSLQEALSMGIPCIGTAVGGIPDAIDDGENGFLISPNPEVDEIARTIEKYYYADSETKERLRDGAYTTWKNKLNAVDNAKQLCEQIDGLIG